MTDKAKLTTGLLTTMLLLAVADIIVIEGLPGSKVIADTTDTKPPVIEAKKKRPTLPEGAVAKHDGPNVMNVITERGVETTDAREPIILSRIVEGEKLQSKVLLQDGDRAGMIAWVDSSKVKKHYLVLKESLHSAFTPEVEDLLDETQRREGRPTRNLLTFYDPGLLSERVVFVRVRERLYEFHVSEGKSRVIFDIIEDLTK